MTHIHQWLPTYSLHLSLSKNKTRCDQLDMKAYFALWYPYSAPEISLFISEPSLNLHYLFPTCSLTSTPFSHLLWASTKPACTLTFPCQGPSACSSHFLPWRRQFFLSHDPSKSLFLAVASYSSQLGLSSLSWPQKFNSGYWLTAPPSPVILCFRFIWELFS